MSCKGANFEPAQVMDEANVHRTWDNFVMKWMAPEAAIIIILQVQHQV